MCRNDGVQEAKGHCMSCGLRNTTQNRSQDLQLVQTQTPVCAVQILCLKDIICFFTAPCTHARKHTLTNTNQNGTACSSLPSGLTAL